LANREAGDLPRLGGTRERVGYVVIGLGVGALVDGFVLHELLQWHHLWSRRTTDKTLAGLEENTLADGIFHAAFLLVLFAGIGLISGGEVRRRPLIGLGLVGWGLFHVTDQILFHLALGAHHIRMDVENPELYDWTFTGIGVVLILVGWLIARSTPRAGVRART
jgi:uncharacterized membrane protein